MMTEAIKETNILLVELSHEYRLFLSSYKVIDALQNMNTLVEHLRPYASKICIAATNAATYMTTWKGCMDIFLQNNSESVKTTAFHQATLSKNDLDKYREELEFKEKDRVAEAISDYIVFLRRLFNVNFNINYEVPNIKPVNKED